jgi:hypothetical protein
MFEVVQNVALLVFTALWFGVMIVLFSRFRRDQRAYLQRFPPVNGIPLDMAMGGNPFGAVDRSIYGAMFRHQDDPALERLRREMWRRYRTLAIWLFGFPVLTFGVAFFLIFLGVIH